MNNWPSLEEIIWTYNHRLEKLAIEMVMNFEDMFVRELPSVSGGPYQFADISSPTSFKGLCAGQGFYLILSDYVPPWKRQNACKLTVDGLPVMYRGQADKVRERLTSHLDHRRYQQSKKEKAQPVLEHSLKLDEVKGNKGGINFDEVPFNRARWAVAVLPMPKSTSKMRELVEWAFDQIFERPVASNERKKIPHAVKTAIDSERERCRTMKMASDIALEEFAKLYPDKTVAQCLAEPPDNRRALRLVGY